MLNPITNTRINKQKISIKHKFSLLPAKKPSSSSVPCDWHGFLASMAESVSFASSALSFNPLFSSHSSFQLFYRFAPKSSKFVANCPNSFILHLNFHRHRFYCTTDTEVSSADNENQALVEEYEKKKEKEKKKKKERKEKKNEKKLRKKTQMKNRRGKRVVKK